MLCELRVLLEKTPSKNICTGENKVAKQKTESCLFKSATVTQVPRMRQNSSNK